MNNEPVAYAMFKDDEFYDAIHPKQYTEHIGSYTIPLYTHPVKEQELLDEIKTLKEERKKLKQKVKVLKEKIDDFSDYKNRLQY